MSVSGNYLLTSIQIKLNIEWLHLSFIENLLNMYYLAIAPKGAEARAPDSRTGASALHKSSKLGNKLDDVTSSCRAPLTCSRVSSNSEGWNAGFAFLRTPSICRASSS